MRKIVRYNFSTLSRRHSMTANKNRIFILLFTFLLWAAANANAGAGIFSSDRDGFYMGLDLGIAIQQGLKIDGNDNDVPTRCDQILRGAEGADNTQFSDITADSITNRTPTDGCGRGDSFGGDGVKVGTGIIGGGQAGYIFGNFRAEAEYVYRAHGAGDRTGTGIASDKDSEIRYASQGINNLSSHSLFANIYYDFLNGSAITPYAGAGAGWSRVSMLYDVIFTRNHDPSTFSDNTPDIAAGTTTRTEDRLTDNVFGWQVIVGSDYEIDKNWSIGLKFRYLRLGKIEDGDRWDQLRSHESAISAPTDDDYTNTDAQSTPEIRSGVANFDPEVRYRIKTDNPSVWSGALNLKYKFGGGNGAVN